MDIRTGKTYANREEALADGVPESALAYIEFRPNGEPEPQFTAPPKVTFTKGSFKRVTTEA